MLDAVLVSAPCRKLLLVLIAFAYLVMADGFAVTPSAFATSADVSSVIPWVVDSGATRHMTNDASRFVSLRPEHGYVRTAGKAGSAGSRLQAVGVGDLALSMIDTAGVPRTVILRSVWYVPDSSASFLGPQLEADLWQGGVWRFGCVGARHGRLVSANLQ